MLGELIFFCLRYVIYQVFYKDIALLFHAGNRDASFPAGIVQKSRMWQGLYCRNMQKREMSERKYANSAYVVIILVHLWNRYQESFEHVHCV